MNTDISMSSDEMQLYAANGGENRMNGSDKSAGSILTQGGVEEHLRGRYGFNYPEWAGASEKEKRTGKYFVTTENLKAAVESELGMTVDVKAMAGALRNVGGIKAPSAGRQTREPGVTPAEGKSQRGFYMPPLRTTERDAEINRDVEHVGLAVARDAAGVVRMAALPDIATMKKPLWLRNASRNTALEALIPPERVGFVENLPVTFLNRRWFVTGFTKPKEGGGKHVDGSLKLSKIPHMADDGGGVALRTFEELGEPGSFTVTVKGVSKTAGFVGLHLYHGRERQIVCLDVDDVLSGGDVIRDGAELVAVVCRRLGGADFRVEIIRAAVEAGHWVERSTSKTGIHIWILGVSPVGTKSGGCPIEIYDHSMTEAPNGERGFIALGVRIPVARGEADDCGDGVEPADSLIDGQDIINSVVGHYWPVVGARGVNDSNDAGSILTQGGGSETLALPEAASYHATRSKVAREGGLDARWAHNLSAKAGVALLQSDLHVQGGELGAQVQRFLDVGLKGTELVDVQQVIDMVNGQYKTAWVNITGVNSGVSSDHDWHTCKTWALLQGAIQEPWLLNHYRVKFPNGAGGDELRWVKADGSADRSSLLWVLYRDLLKLVQPKDEEERRRAVHVITKVVESSGAWDWLMARRSGDEGGARKLLWDEVQKASSHYMEYRAKVEKERVDRVEREKSAVQQASEEVTSELRAKASAPWDSKALAAAKSNFSIPLEGVGVWCHLSKGKRPAPLCTPENMGLLIMRYGCRVRWNEMRHSLEYEGFGVDDGDHDAALNIAYMLSMRNGLGWKIDDVDRAFTSWAQSFKFHPAREWIDGKSWDGISRIEQLADSVTVQEGQRDNWQMYFRRWALGAVNALYSYTGGGSKFMLVLQGQQSAGKTRWFRTLAGGQTVCKDGVMLDVKNKDSVAETLTWWLIELGELEATYTTRQIAELKAFVTKLDDEWRSPYGRKVNKYPRRTVFIGTVNKDEPLADYTGNTRFATVTTEAIRVDHGVDVQQFWAEVLHLWNTGTEDQKRHWLTKAEEAAMEQQNAQYVAKGGFYDALEYAFDWSPEGLADMHAKVAVKDTEAFAFNKQIYEVLGFVGRDPNQAQKNEITSALEKLGAVRPHNSVMVKGRQGRGFWMPKYRGDPAAGRPAGYLN